MNFNEWEPVYAAILNDFGFSRDEDEHSAQFLSDLLEEKGDSVLPLEKLQSTIKDKEVIVCGKAPRLSEDVVKLHTKREKVIVAADGATTVLLSHGITPHIIVSDLDGVIDDIIEANKRCAIIIVHAHGDNIAKLKKYVPQLTKIIGTTQSRPLPNVFNFGGFTDGDRAVYLAKYLGAKKISIIGFDFEDATVGAIKKKKLLWARRLIAATDAKIL
ncbi:MAG TPA: 6-hydroxymethylpterin diphosphokinase MptE-like protein [Candidatus Acidoferrales bacterium]|nr:6-hydroxymethylpterin diphosphokinase MptE-like protein [Candidatus Acidoferrales bacterium]